ncbi:helix-turn-helix domain-containing protein [Flavobacterium sp. HSC-61S13]|uniref:helix-turn-helix domain-containing protein n=1 Tax=Flavobacterium sp. HSC-61S13 TaxID=2910963 RepID=UPI00209E8B30|nr:helix-turn-helix transcriptional regulator [Flavobacterium sp. HSC-61S13]MCP1995291.1 transcriptional regulator with XRE-family HTH domain [Flavobacterium sp. HSC-61S13]
MEHKTIHQGRNIKRFREMLGIKQEALAFDLGEDWNQKKISILENKEVVDKSLLKDISQALKIPVEAFENFDEEQAINLISNTANFENCLQPAFFSFQPTFHPVDKILELHEEKIALYERMLIEKDDMILQLKELINTFK